MMANKTYTITEYGSFLRDKKIDGYVSLPPRVFDKLETFVLENASKGTEATELMGFSFKKNVGKVITAKNYVGVIALDDGTIIEILPKICGEDDTEEVKKLLIRMLKSLQNSPFKSMQSTNLDVAKLPVSEIFIRMFITETFAVVKRGLKSGYETVEDNLTVCKGKIDFSNQIRHNLVHKEKFYVRYDEFNNNRPENKLVKSTLKYLYRFSSSSKNKADLKTLLNVFENVDESVNYDADFAKCSSDRNSKYYNTLLMWCKVFLKGKSFTSFAGSEVAYALLFPMETVFESYIAQQLRKIVNSDEYTVSTQHAEKYLFTNIATNKNVFKLIPDIVIKNKQNKKLIFIMDTKWKLLNNNPSANYGISQADMYQMYAYQKKYKSQNVTLLYPMTEEIDESAPISYKADDNVTVNVRFVNLSDIKTSLENIFEDITSAENQQ